MSCNKNIIEKQWCQQKTCTFAVNIVYTDSISCYMPVLKHIMTDSHSRSFMNMPTPTQELDYSEPKNAFCQKHVLLKSLLCSECILAKTFKMYEQFTGMEKMSLICVPQSLLCFQLWYWQLFSLQSRPSEHILVLVLILSCLRTHHRWDAYSHWWSFNSLANGRF